MNLVSLGLGQSHVSLVPKFMYGQQLSMNNNQTCFRIVFYGYHQLPENFDKTTS